LNLEFLKERKQRRRALALAAAAFLGWQVFGGGQGLFSLLGSWHEAWSLKREIASLQKQQQDLQGEEASLAHDREFYEKLAREKLMLKEPGEVVYRFDKRP
jgi:cell division protein FtsB